MGKKQSKPVEEEEHETMAQKMTGLYIKCLIWTILLGSIAMLITSIVASQAASLKTGFGAFIAFGPMTLSIFLILFSAMSICGCMKWRSTKIVYFVTTIIAAFVIIIAGIMTLIVVKYSNKAADTPSDETVKGAGADIQTFANDLAMATWNECCYKRYNVSRAVSCDNPDACPASQIGIGQGCACIQDPSNYFWIVDEVTGSQCDKLAKAEVEFNGYKFLLVGDPKTTSGCGSVEGKGYIKLYQQHFAQYSDDKLTPLGATFAVVGTFLMIGAVGAFACIFPGMSKAGQEAEEPLVEMQEKGKGGGKKNRGNAYMDNEYNDMNEENAYEYEEDNLVQETDNVVEEDNGVNPFAEPDDASDDKLTMA